MHRLLNNKPSYLTVLYYNMRRDTLKNRIVRYTNTGNGHPVSFYTNVMFVANFAEINAGRA